MKFQCSICGSEVSGFSVCKRYILRDDYIQAMQGKSPARIDREYLDCEVLEVIYKCKCGERIVKDDPHLEDFIVDADVLCKDRFTQTKYGTLLLIEKEKDD